MIEVYPNLFVGNTEDVATAINQDGWFIVHACKEPYHRQALGYRGQGAPKNHPEYLIARRENRLILNLVDAANPDYIPKQVIDAAVDAIATNIGTKKVLVHCNQGMSRSPTIAFLYLIKHTSELTTKSLTTALDQFKAIYPLYHPAQGTSGFVERHFREYAS